MGIAVDFVGDHLKDKKATEFNTFDKRLSEDLGFPIPFSTIQVIASESVRYKSAKTYTAEPESQASLLRTLVNKSYSDAGVDQLSDNNFYKN